MLCVAVILCKTIMEVSFEMNNKNDPKKTTRNDPPKGITGISFNKNIPEVQIGR